MNKGEPSSKAKYDIYIDSGLYCEGKDTKKSVIEEFAVKRFGEYGGYAQQYLFDYARNNLNL